MRNEFAWYLGSSSEGAKVAWQTGILTVDANVLLDLYRYHTSTCESIVAALEAFAGRLWISHHAATEFFANRKRVIASSEKVFREASSAIDELDKSTVGAVGRLKGYRLLPRAALDELSETMVTAITQARSRMEEAAGKHPNYLAEDPLLERLLKLFDGRIGAALPPEKKAELLKEGPRRHAEQIPPGYMDDGKEGDRRYGDFLLWSEIMSFAKEAGLPVLLVTSERKEDWWEVQNGKTLGPRAELLEEFWKTTGQMVHIYQTENFLRIAAEQAGNQVNDEVVEEIRDVDARKGRQRPHPPAVRVQQLPRVAQPLENQGALEIELLREVFNMTGSGRFHPELDAVPELSARVTASPEGCPTLHVSVGTGTTFDFNVHVRSAIHGHSLPVGLYVIDYMAECTHPAPADVPGDGGTDTHPSES